MTTPSIEGVQFLGVTINFEVPVDRNLYDLGAVTLEKDGRNFVLDVCQSYTNDAKDEIKCDVEVDTEIFPIGQEFNYTLNADDLMEGVNGTLFIGEDWEEFPLSITLFVKIGEMTKAIDLTVE